MLHMTGSVPASSKIPVDNLYLRNHTLIQGLRIIIKQSLSFHFSQK